MFEQMCNKPERLNLVEKAVVNNRYIIHDILGKGGQGTVYLVSDRLENDNLKALKTLSKSTLNSLLRYEFEAVKRMEHLHLVKVFDLGKVFQVEGRDGPLLDTMFFTSEFVNGSASNQWIKTIAEPGIGRVAAAVRIVSAVASALDLVHRYGLLHRDIKPSNILVGDEGHTVRLIDFGLAVDGKVSDGLKAGTIGYTAEEALHGFPEERSDIYSLGITLIELLTDKKPRAFFPPYPNNVLHSVVKATDSDLLNAIIERMTSQKAERRFFCAGDVSKALSLIINIGATQQYSLSDIICETYSTSDKGGRVTKARSIRLSGRLKETEKLLSIFEDRPNNSVQTLAISGPPGVGKSRFFKTAVVTAQIRAAEKGNTPPELICGSLRSILTSLVRASGETCKLLQCWIEGRIDSLPNRECTNEVSLITEIAEVFWKLNYPAIILIEDNNPHIALAVLHLLRRMSRVLGPSVTVAVEIRGMVPKTVTSVDVDIPILEIPPLSIEEECDMVTQILGRPAAVEFQKKIHRMSGGIPLAVEAILLALLDTRPNGKFEETDLDKLLFQTDPLDAAIKSFLEGLDPLAKNTIEFLAVIGEQVSLESLTSTFHIQNEAILVEYLRTLEKQGWVDIDNGSISLKTFSAKRLTTMISSRRLRELHQKAIILLDKTGTAAPWKIADHAYAAEDWERAKTAAKDAYIVLIAAGDLTGGAIYLSRAISLKAFSTEEEGRLRVLLARLYRQTGEYRLAIDTVSVALETASNNNDSAYLEQALSLRLLGETSSAVEILKVLKESNNHDVKGAALSTIARIELERGHLESARKLVEQISFEQLSSEVYCEISASVGLVFLSSGNDDRALFIFAQGIEKASSRYDYKSLARFNGLMGMQRHRTSNFIEAAAFYSEAVKFAKKAGDRHGAATHILNLAAALTELGRFSESLEAYREGLSQIRLFGRPGELSLAGANYAELLFRLGDLAGAETVSRLALEDARCSNSQFSGTILCVRGDILVALNRYDEARLLFEEAEARSGVEKSDLSSDSARLHLAELAIDIGDFENATHYLNKISLSAHNKNASLQLEYQRLLLKLTTKSNGDIALTLKDLLRLLPTDQAYYRDEHLKAFVEVARAAFATGQKAESCRAATAASIITSSMQKKIPSLYQKADAPYLREMNMIINKETSSHLFESSYGWEHLARINTRLNSEFRVGRLLEMIMDAALDITHAERGFLLIASPKGELKIRCARNMDKESLSLEEAGFSRGAALRAFEMKEPLLTTDARDDDRFNEMISVVRFNLRYIAAIPLLVDGKAQGTIYLDSKQPGRFDETRLALLEALADQAAIALTNARLRLELDRRQARIERLNRDLAGKLERREGELEEVKEQLEKRTTELINRYKYDEIVAHSKPMVELFRLLDRIVAADFPVIIGGESGTGKELVARAIHFNSARKKKSFVAENCAAIPESLMESVFFGHAKGAFTGAVVDSRGLFVEADGGTLFLDEIADLPLSIQAKLLRVLQNHEVRPVGGTKTRTVNVRILAATNSDLKAHVKEGSFREDLYYRLNVIEITLPPLRKRKEDILLLAEHFIAKHSSQKKLITKAAAEILIDYSWPGNVRQLENEIIRSVVLSEKEIGPEHLSQDIVTQLEEMSVAETNLDINLQVDRLKKRLLTAALRDAKGNQTAAATMLGISRFGLQKMMRRLNLK